MSGFIPETEVDADMSPPLPPIAIAHGIYTRSLARSAARRGASPDAGAEPLYRDSPSDQHDPSFLLRPRDKKWLAK